MLRHTFRDDDGGLLGNLVGRACLIYVDDVKVIGRSVEGLKVILCMVLLRFKRGLFLAAHKLVLFAKEVKWCGKLYLGTARQTRPRARAWTGGDAPASDGGRTDEVSQAPS